MEEWRLIHQEPGYSISSLGRVMNNFTKHIKSIRYDRYGYPRVTLYPSGRTYTIHRLIMTNFYPAEMWNEHVNHIDNNRANSILSNLEWVTAKENIAHVFRQNRNHDVNGELNPMAKLSIHDVWNIRYWHWDLSTSLLSYLYEVGEETIRKIRVFESWKGV